MITTFCRITTIGLIVLIGLLCSTTTSMADVLEDALIWLFDENGGDTAEDASGNGHDGSGQNGSRAKPEGLLISMETDIVEIRHVFNPESISAWIKTNPNGKWREPIRRETEELWGLYCGFKIVGRELHEPTGKPPHNGRCGR